MWPNLRAVLIVTTLALGGCVIPVPVMEDPPFKEDDLTPIAPGKSTRVDVLFTLGEPHMVSADEKLFVYSAVQMHVELWLIGGGGSGGTIIPIYAGHYLVIEFTPESRVAKFETVTGSIEDYCPVEGHCFSLPGICKGIGSLPELSNCLNRYR